MMDLHHLPPEGLRLKGTTERVELEGGVSLRDLDWSVFALASDGDVFLEVKGHAIWQGACSRCLTPLDRTLRVESQFLGSKDSDLVARGSHNLGTQDLDVVFLPEERIDEAELVREQFELQAPMHPLCTDNCQGLCPTCGKNWNKGLCHCPPEGEQAPSALNKALTKALAGIKLDPES
ncbi:MAG TPA: YceD family protein [Geothrix sp.]|nr:YceD family protein [Geothrix sp.]